MRDAPWIERAEQYGDPWYNPAQVPDDNYDETTYEDDEVNLRTGDKLYETQDIAKEMQLNDEIYGNF